MKKTLLILGLFMLTISFAYSTGTGYYYYTSTGTTSPFFWQPSAYGITPTNILSAPSSNLLSGTQTLPFSWNFYGNTVTSYKVSTAGYITFDPNATKSIQNSTTLPDTASPKNAIFAFWTNLEVKTSTTIS